jgi:hypothetical protein
MGFLAEFFWRYDLTLADPASFQMPDTSGAEFVAGLKKVNVEIRRRKT